MYPDHQQLLVLELQKQLESVLGNGPVIKYIMLDGQMHWMNLKYPVMQLEGGREKHKHFTIGKRKVICKRTYKAGLPSNNLTTYRTIMLRSMRAKPPKAYSVTWLLLTWKGLQDRLVHLYGQFRYFKHFMLHRNVLCRIYAMVGAAAYPTDLDYPI